MSASPKKARYWSDLSEAERRSFIERARRQLIVEDRIFADGMRRARGERVPGRLSIQAWGSEAG